ncbi:hypothetical protein PV726_46110 [Streptomyces europaeiscabiei]|uniref:hypothetical protein n=1 Tax=Streptomyces europaeiscabiei TaxID=146819 RepID=UPI0029B28609|nr:hypothetical protein [Streptomyces europaeiscabiei]MDX3697453.1 hypothetical protein [Streptomyces europaeiscabiei]
MLRGQLALFPVRRRFERGDARRIKGRTWPEEEVLQALAGQRAASAGRSGTWLQMVLRLIRCALAIRDAEGEVLVGEEMLDQVRLPLKAAAAELLAQAGLLRPRTNPPPVSWPARSCADCVCWGVTTTLCRGCAEWRKNRDRYRVDQCPRCRRDGLPLHAGNDLCRGCLAYVHEVGPQTVAVSLTQLTFAGPLAHQLKRRAGELGFVVHQRSGPLSRARARAREVSAPASRAVPVPVLAGQLALFSMPRTWRREPHAPVLALPPLPAPAQELLDTCTAGYPRAWLADKRNVPGGAALVLHTLLARLGPHEPIPERDVRSLSGTVAAGTAATCRVISFLRAHALLEANEHVETPRQLLADVQLQVHPRVPDVSQGRRDRHDEKALHARIARLPAPMADQLSAWVRVLRGQGRYRHPPADWRLIRRYLGMAWSTLTSWTAAGLDLRQVTAGHIESELARYQGNVARGLLGVLRSIFRALKQERVIFRNPTAGLRQRAGVHLPRPLSSDRLAGVLDRLDGPAARLIVGLVAIYAVRAVEVARLALSDPDLARRTLAARRSEHTHLVYLDDLSTTLVADWLRERRRRWPQATNPHLLITSQTYRHTRPPRRSATARCGSRSTRSGCCHGRYGPTASWTRPGRPPIRSTSSASSVFIPASP